MMIILVLIHFSIDQSELARHQYFREFKTHSKSYFKHFDMKRVEFNQGESSMHCFSQIEHLVIKLRIELWVVTLNTKVFLR